MAITEKRKTGDLGEKLVSFALKKQGFSLVERNYLRKWGEIDIVAQKRGKIHFVEVKTVRRETSPNVSRVTFFSPVFSFLKGFFSDASQYLITDITDKDKTSVSYETGFRPEDNLHPWKLQRLRRTIQTYLIQKGMGEEDEWQFDAVCVYLDEKGRRADIEWLWDVVL